MVEEAPYWLLVRELGHSEADRTLAEDPDAGALVAIGERPSADALTAEMSIDASTGSAQEGTVPSHRRCCRRLNSPTIPKCA